MGCYSPNLNIMAFRPSLPFVKIVYFWPETTGKTGALPKWMGSSCTGCTTGTHLGPFIFNMFINDISYVLENVWNSYNYTHNNALLNSHHPITCIKTKLEITAAVAMHWFDVNGMKSNQAKFQAMVLNNHPDLSYISLSVNDMNILPKPCVKLLGVPIDCELNFSDQVTYLFKVHQDD